MKKSNSRYVYILGSNTPFTYKFGISSNVKERMRFIENGSEIGIKVFCIAKFYVQDAEKWESRLLRFYSPLRCYVMDSSGKTEWVWLIFPILPIVFLSMLFVWQRYWLVVCFMVMFFIYITFNF